MTARRFMMPGRSERWEFVGVSAHQTGATLSYPATAMAGDVAILAYSSTNVGTAPAGFSLIASGSSLQFYRICTGGETSVARPASTGGGVVLMFRPIGGSATFYSGVTDNPAASRTMALPSDKVCLVVGIGNTTSTTTWNTPVMPVPFTLHAAVPTGPALQVSSAVPAKGTSSTGGMLVSASASGRQTFGVFTF